MSHSNFFPPAVRISMKILSSVISVRGRELPGKFVCDVTFMMMLAKSGMGYCFEHAISADQFTNKFARRRRYHKQCSGKLNINLTINLKSPIFVTYEANLSTKELVSLISTNVY